MTLEQNITAILESYFSGFKDELIEACAKRIMEQVKRHTDDAYFRELMDAVERGEMSDASANQAWYEYISKEVEESDTSKCESCEYSEREWYDEPCEGCHNNSGYKPKDEQPERSE